MKWSAFKEHVDKEINGQDPEIFYIDVEYPRSGAVYQPKGMKVKVSIDPKIGLMIDDKRE